MTTKLEPFALTLVLIAVPCVVACGDKDGEDTGGSGTDTSDGTDGSAGGTDTAGTDGDTEGVGDCPGIDPAASVNPNGACMANADCKSGVCVMYRDVPPPTDAVCGELPAGCGTRVTGTVLDFVTQQSIGSVDVKIAKALEAATDPQNVTPVLTATSDATGRIDVTTAQSIMAAIGIVALVGGGDYYLTATGVATPVSGTQLYAPGVGIHEFWTLPAATLTEWSTALTPDAAFDGFLPLGPEGGVVGLIRDDSTGMPVAGAKVVPAKDTSNAVIRYLASDGTFASDMSTETGIFVLVAPGLAEKFKVQLNGTDIQVEEGTAGSASGAVFTLVMDVVIP